MSEELNNEPDHLVDKLNRRTLLSYLLITFIFFLFSIPLAIAWAFVIRFGEWLIEVIW